MPVPLSQLDDLERILFTEEQIASRVAELGARISEDYRDKDLVLTGILKGGVFFLSDLSRRIALPHEYDLVGAQSYKTGTMPAAQVRITKDIDINIRGRDVLLIEDIYDTGNTLSTVRAMIEMDRPRSVEICTLISKNKHRDHPVDIKYVGFEIEDCFVVGYGLDYRERYRNLGCIGILHPEFYQ